MYTKNKNSRVFSLFEELKPRHKITNKKRTSSLVKVSQNHNTPKIKTTSTTTATTKNSLNFSSSMIHVEDKRDKFRKTKPQIQLTKQVNHRNKKATISNFLLFQRTSSNQSKPKVSLNNTTTNIISTSLIKHKLNQSHFNTLEHNEIDFLIEKINHKVKHNKNGNKGIIDIVKKGLMSYKQIIKGKKHKKYILKLVDALNKVNFQNEEKPIENKEQFPQEITEDKILLKVNQKKNFNLDNNQNHNPIYSITVNKDISYNIDNKDDYDVSNEQSSEGYCSFEELDSIQFTDKIRKDKCDSMPNLKLPKLNFNFTTPCSSKNTAIKENKNKNNKVVTHSYLAEAKKHLYNKTIKK